MFVCYLSYLSGVCKCSNPIPYQAVVFYKETAFLLWITDFNYGIEMDLFGSPSQGKFS